jgi:AcrR family transcriptional regulator
MNGNTKRDRLIDAAAELMHHKGLINTSLADIANKAAIPIGNVYYYFKTKEELALSVIERRRTSMNKAYALLNQNFADPRERLTEALRFFDNIKKEYTTFGCPLGRLIAELEVATDTTAQEAAKVLNEFCDWAASQFKALGHEADAAKYAASLMAGIQGATIMAKAVGKPSVFSAEIQRLIEWIENMPNKRIHAGKVSAA